jgi:uncharacterized protein
MRIEIAKLRENPVHYDVDFSEEFMQENLGGEIRLDPARGRVTFHMAGQDVLASGKLRSVLRGRCDRCLGEVTRPLEADVAFYFRRRTSRDEDRIVDVEEPDYALFDGETIDPDNDLRELLLVEIPGFLICGEDCRGLCPRCGANLNETTCECDKQEDDDVAAQQPPKNASWKAQLKNVRLPREG